MTYTFGLDTFGDLNSGTDGKPLWAEFRGFDKGPIGFGPVCSGPTSHQTPILWRRAVILTFLRIST